MKQRYEATIGVVERDTETGEFEIYGGQTDNGECYKDLTAWKKGQYGTDFNIIYVGEYGLIDWANRKNNNVEIEDVSWTRESWIDWVRDELSFEGIEDSEFAEYLAEDIFNECDWQDLSTMLEEWIQHNDVEEFYEEWRDSR